jgi:hydroxymethylbilane synthase
LLSDLHGGCLAPIAALGTITEIDDQGRVANRIHLVARVLSLDGRVCLESDSSCEIELESGDWHSVAVQLGQTVSAMLIDQGAKPLIEAGR